VTYDGNRFYSTAYEDDVYRNNLVPGAHTVEGLNTLVVDRGQGDTTKKSPLETNVGETSPITVAAIRLAPAAILDDHSTGGDPGLTESMLSWVWNGGCAELDQLDLDPQAERSGFASAAPGLHELSVWSGGECSGLADQEAEDVVFSGPNPAASLSAVPNVISDGDSSDLAWNLISGDLITGVISHGAMDEVTAASGSVQVTPGNTVDYILTLVTKQGGVVGSAPVWVDEEPPYLFIDDFETADLSRWSASVR
jgi:hypothetical protein